MYRILVRGVFALVLTAGLAAACSSGGDDVSSPTAPTPSTPAPTVGRLAIYSSTTGWNSMTVTLDGASVGTLTASRSAAPSCSPGPDTIVVERGIGTYALAGTTNNGARYTSQGAVLGSSCYTVNVSLGSPNNPPPTSGSNSCSAQTLGGADWRLTGSGRCAGSIVRWDAARNQGTLISRPSTCHLLTGDIVFRNITSGCNIEAYTRDTETSAPGPYRSQTIQIENGGRRMVISANGTWER
jgi:hypothetical protein